MKRLTFCLLLVACGNSNKSSTDAPSSVDSPLSTVDAPLRVPPATTFDCMHGWSLEGDDTGAVVTTPYSELGVCIKFSRYTDSASNLPLKSCSELAAGATTAEDKAYQQGCRPFTAHPPAFAKPLARTIRPAFAMTMDAPTDAVATRSTTTVSRSTTTTADVAACDPLAQTGCAANEKCTWVIDLFTGADATGHVGCVANGTVANGQACMVGAGGPMATGFDNCQKGSVCNSGICKTVCDTNGGAPNCGTTGSCVTYNNLFANVGEVAVAGACDPNCDPLTQTVGSVAACGSPNPANPTKGCYGFWQSGGKSRFSCANVGNLNAKQDFVIGTRIFINSCAPGFFPGLVMGSGSMQAICSAFCNPADVYQGHDQGKGGVLLPGNPAALATCGDRGAL
jgi:hypothetical protein